MTALRDPFDTIHKKDIKNKAGQVVAQVDYVGWSQSADRLDEADGGWSFAILQLGPDWALGRLTLKDGRTFENVGYAENADMDWKKEPLKDAVSDAFKRCAALAGVARYLYDKDAHTTQGRASASPARPASAPRATVTPPPSSGGLPEEPDYVREQLAEEHRVFADVRVERPVAVSGGAECPIHHLGWVLQPAGTSKAGKDYDAFWKCPAKVTPFCKENPDRTPAGKAWMARQEIAA